MTKTSELIPHTAVRCKRTFYYASLFLLVDIDNHKDDNEKVVH